MQTTAQRIHAARRSAECWASLRVGLLSAAYAENGDVKDERAREAIFYADRECFAALHRAHKLASA